MINNNSNCTQKTKEKNKINITNSTQSQPETMQNVSPRYSIASGDYVATIENVKHFKHKKHHHDVVQMWLEISDEAGNMELLPKYYNINSKDSRQFMQAELARIGLEIESPNDMKKLPKKLSGMEIPVTLDFNDQGYPIVYFREVFEEVVSAKDLTEIWED